MQYKLNVGEKNTAFLCSYFSFFFLRTTHMEIKKVFTLNYLYRTEKQLGTVGTNTLVNLKINLSYMNDSIYVNVTRSPLVSIV